MPSPGQIFFNRVAVASIGKLDSYNRSRREASLVKRLFTAK